MFDAPSCLLWDVDGTLIDTTQLIIEALGHIYKRFFDRTLPELELRGLIGIPLKRQIRVFGEPETFGTDEAALTAAFIAFYESNRSREQILDEVVALLIEGRQAGYPTALVTSKNDAELANTLPRLGIARWIDAAITADTVSRPKPAPDGVLLALQRLRVAPDRAQRALYIGDTAHDMEAARAAGVRAAGVTWGAAPRPLLAARSPDFLCDTPEELRHILFG